MSTSDKTFSQVKAILGKLDQRIDSLRERRTAPTVTSGNPPPALTNSAIANQTIGAAEAASAQNGSQQIGTGRAAPLPGSNGSIGNAAAAAAAAAAARSPYGRAMPLRNVS
jgi:hypothetical protein